MLGKQRALFEVPLQLAIGVRGEKNIHTYIYTYIRITYECKLHEKLNVTAIFGCREI